MKLITSPQLNAAIATLEEARRRLQGLRGGAEKAPGAAPGAAEAAREAGPEGDGHERKEPEGRSHRISPGGVAFADRQGGMEGCHRKCEAVSRFDSPTEKEGGDNH